MKIATAKLAGIIAAGALVVTGGTVGALYATGVIGGAEKEPPVMQYAMKGVVLMDDTDRGELESESYIALEFKNNAYSKDGKTFECYLGNSPINKYDMFIAIYTDASFDDQVYLSGLVPPGSAFEEITLDRTLEVGDHRMCVAFTQVEDDGVTAHAQTLYTMDFHVEG